MQKNVTADRAYYISESKKWLSALSELRMENILLKESLSDAISREVSLQFVDQAEKFQQLFIEKDQVMDLLRYEIIMLLSRLSGGEMTAADERQCIVLEKDIDQFMLDFQQMQLSFHSFLETNKLG
jgi:hypothetical protein